MRTNQTFLVLAGFFILAVLPLAKADPNQIIDSKPAPPPKWTEPELWRKKLRAGLPENAIENLLGKPLCKIEGSDGAIWFYQAMPEIAPYKQNTDRKQQRIPIHSKTLRMPDYGLVIFKGKERNSPKQQSRILLVVDSWKEPDWQRLKENPPILQKIIPAKQRPIRKPELWEKPESWRKLTVGMSSLAAQKIIGPPKYEHIGSAEHKSKKCFYSDVVCADGFFVVSEINRMVHSIGVISISDDKVEYWSEPYWPEVEKALYESVDPNIK